MVLLLHQGTCFNLRSTTEPLVRKAQLNQEFDYDFVDRYRFYSLVPFPHELLLLVLPSIDRTSRAGVVDFTPNEYPRGCLVCLSLYQLLPRHPVLFFTPLFQNRTMLALQKRPTSQYAGGQSTAATSSHEDKQVGIQKLTLPDMRISHPIHHRLAPLAESSSFNTTI
ncbi:hypothetical protein ACSQ67_016610 [Phaseolus vulgaris]